MSQMSEIVIFCENYVEVNCVLQLAIQNYQNRRVTIIFPGFPDLFKFFQIINERVFHNTINLIFISPFEPRRAKAKGINKISSLFSDVIKEKRYLKDVFTRNLSKLQGCEVFFYSPAFNGLKIYLLKRLVERNELVYVPSPGVSEMKASIPANMVELANLIIWKLVYGRDVTIGSLPYYRGFTYVSGRFIKKEVKRIVDSSEIAAMMRGFDLSRFRVFDTGDYDAIYFDDNIIGGGYVPDTTTFKRELAAIFGILKKYFPEEKIAYKYHPGYTGDQTMITFGHELASFIPAELLYSDKVKLYLSVFSMSIANVEKGLAVSLADLITFKNNEVKNLLKEQFRQSCKSKVLFPASLDEFERIVLDIADKARQGEAPEKSIERK